MTVPLRPLGLLCLLSVWGQDGDDGDPDWGELWGKPKCQVGLALGVVWQWWGSKVECYDLAWL